MISLQASDIFFCIRYDYLQDQNSAGSLFKELLFYTQYAFLPAFLRYKNAWKANAGIFFLVYSACMNFFSLNFPLHEFFFCTSPTHLPPHNFSNGPSLSSLILTAKPWLAKKVLLQGNRFAARVRRRKCVCCSQTNIYTAFL